MFKTTILGGLVFLLPFGILLLVLEELLGFALYLAQPLVALFPDDDYFGISLAGLLAVVMILLACYVAGVVARQAVMSGFSAKTDEFLTNIVPGYGMIRTRIAATLNNESFATSRQVVSVSLGGLKRYAFLIEEFPETGEVLIFVPGAPNAENGILGRVARDEITSETVPVHVIMRSFQFYGRGLSEYSGEATPPSEEPTAP